MFKKVFDLIKEDCKKFSADRFMTHFIDGLIITCFLFLLYTL